MGVHSILQHDWQRRSVVKPLNGVSILDLLGGLFYPFILFMLMPIVMGMIVYEKEHRLRVIMKMMGYV